MPTLAYTHVDVFASTPFSGNSLPVFTDANGLNADQMLRITQELRHFEAIFLRPDLRSNTVRARVFDLFGELPFAGHPIIGGAAALHHLSGGDSRSWVFELPTRSVTLTTERTVSGFAGLLDQGTPEFLGTVRNRKAFATAFDLKATDLHPELPLEVVSTGLRYLIIPLVAGVLERARIRHDLTAVLQNVGAEFAVLLDEAALEIRHWNNDGIIEDIATGSAAGTIGAYRLRHGLTKPGTSFVLNQGRFTGRPSQIRVQANGSPEVVNAVQVGGDVTVVGRGVLEVLP